MQHIEMFAPILVKGLCRMTSSGKNREEKALQGLAKILGREAKEAEKELVEAHEKAHTATKELAHRTGMDHDELMEQMGHDDGEGDGHEEETKKGQLDLLD
jgi:DNA topoisomerase-6 subunit B